MYGNDVSMVDAGQQPPFAYKPRRPWVARPVVNAKKLQRHLAFELRIPGAIDLARGTTAEALDQLEVSPLSNDGRRL